jgi:hypothetical protein
MARARKGDTQVSFGRSPRSHANRLAKLIAAAEAERAVYLFIASQSFFTKSGSSLPLNQSASIWISRHLESVRARLSQEQFSSASAQAQAMTLDEVVKYALEDS